MMTLGIGNNVIPGVSYMNQWQGRLIFRHIDSQMRMNIEKHHGY